MLHWIFNLRHFAVFLNVNSECYNIHSYDCFCYFCRTSYAVFIVIYFKDIFISFSISFLTHQWFGSMPNFHTVSALFSFGVSCSLSDLFLVLFLYSNKWYDFSVLNSLSLYLWHNTWCLLKRSWYGDKNVHCVV